MDIVPIYKRVIGLDVHQAQITGCAITEQPDGSVTYERRISARQRLRQFPHGIGASLF
ncbi:MAG: hypothetical protein ACYCZ6_17930 [Polaromonas sp.]